MPSAMGPAPSITGVPMGHTHRASHRRGTVRPPQRSTSSTSCHHNAPHHQSSVRGKEGLATGYSTSSTPLKWHLSPFQQSTCGSAHMELVGPQKSQGFERRQGCLHFFAAQLPLWVKAPQKRFLLLPSQRSSGGISEEEKRTDHRIKKQFTHTLQTARDTSRII